MPVVWSVVIGQAQVVVTALLLVGAPWAVAVATHLKLLPALVALYWVGRRDWPALGRFVLWAIGLAVVQFVLEPAGSLAFLSFPNLSQVGDVINFSPYAISPLLWAGLVVIGVGLALYLAPTRWGWAAAVAVAVLASPRLLMYQLSSLLAAVRSPEQR
jgi:hypothetical protein